MTKGKDSASISKEQQQQQQQPSTPSQDEGNNHNSPTHSDSKGDRAKERERLARDYGYTETALRQHESISHILDTATGDSASDNTQADEANEASPVVTRGDDDDGIQAEGETTIAAAPIPLEKERTTIRQDNNIVVVKTTHCPSSSSSMTKVDQDTVMVPPPPPDLLERAQAGVVPQSTAGGPGAFRVLGYQQEQVTINRNDDIDDDHDAIPITTSDLDLEYGVGIGIPHVMNVVVTDNNNTTQIGAPREVPTTNDDNTNTTVTNTNNESSNNPYATTTGEILLEAVAVTDSGIDEAERSRLEAEIRQQILQEAVQAEVSTPLFIAADSKAFGLHDAEDEIATEQTKQKNDSNPKSAHDNCSRRKRRRCRLLWSAVILLVVALGLGLGLGLTGDSESNNNNNNRNDPNGNHHKATDEMASGLATLEIVQQRGYVKCGVTAFGFITLHNDDDDSTTITGFNVQQCKAMALLALGDSSLYKVVLVDHYERWQGLANGTFDILTEGATHTMERDVQSSITKTGFSMTVPYFYSGLAFAGNPTFVDCADELEDFHGVCRELKICVLAGSTHVDVLGNLLRGSVIVPYNETEVMVQHLRQDSCNVVAAEPLYLVKLQDLHEGEWKLGSNIVSKEPLAVVTREDDPAWSTLANIMVNAFILAEANNISKATAPEIAKMWQTQSHGSVMDNDLASKMISLIAEFGHHGDLYETYITPSIPRNSVMNTVYDKFQTTGLLYSIPPGDLSVPGPEPVANSTLQTVMERGYLVCGILPSRGTGFAHFDQDTSTWTGFDVEFCKGLAGSLFVGDPDKVDFVELQDMNHSYMGLAKKKVDVVAGARVSLQADYYEPTTGQGYSFSSPYFYNDSNKDPFAFMMREEDVHWSDFVYWIVMATIYAEEEGIGQSNSVDMPVVTLFGETLKQMFRDCISAVGSYAEIYNNTLEAYAPRKGANQLNRNPQGPQLFPIPAA